MSLWRYLGEFLLLRWLFRHRNNSNDRRDFDATTYNPPRRTGNTNINHDYRHYNTHLDSYDPNLTADNDFLDDLDDLDHFDNDF